MATPEISPPAALDIEQLLAPVSAESPAGEDLRRMGAKGGKSILMDEVEERRRAILKGINENLEEGETVDPAALAQKRRGEWRDIERTIIAAFRQGKELSAGVTLVLATVSANGWNAVAPGLRFLRLLQQQYWDTLHPAPETDESGAADLSDRAALLSRLDHENYLPLALRQLSLTDSRRAPSVSWADFESLGLLRSTKMKQEDEEEQRKARVEEITRSIDESVQKSTVEFYQELLKFIDAGLDELNSLREFVEDKYAAIDQEDRPSFRQAEHVLEEARSIASRYWKAKGGGAEQGSVAAEADAAPGGVEEGTRAAGSAPAGDVLALLNRALVLLRAQQPHNPSAFLIQEAIRWTKMPISEWYLETVDDSTMSGFVSKLMRGGSAPEGQ